MSLHMLVVLVLAVVVPVVGLVLSRRRTDAGPRRMWVGATALFALPAAVLLGVAWTRGWNDLSLGTWLVVAVYAMAVSVVPGLLDRGSTGR